MDLLYVECLVEKSKIGETRRVLRLDGVMEDIAVRLIKVKGAESVTS